MVNIWFTQNITRPIKFTMCINKSAEKKKLFYNTPGLLKSVVNL